MRPSRDRRGIVRDVRGGTLTPPVVTDHFGILVVRDDLFPGGTKARFAGQLFDGADEVVYASPAEGGAQTALAIVAQQLEKRATIFVAKRQSTHARTRMAKAHGAKIYQVSPGYLSVVQARARAYCVATGARLAPFGFDLAWSVGAIAEAALTTGEMPEEVWCAGGSGTLARGLAKAWPQARLNVVQVGKGLTVAGATMHKHSLPFGAVSRTKPPFRADPHYDAKAFELCLARHGPGKVLFWNVSGPAD
jgi:hypothetical protein